MPKMNAGRGAAAPGNSARRPCGAACAALTFFVLFLPFAVFAQGTPSDRIKEWKRQLYSDDSTMSGQAAAALLANGSPEALDAVLEAMGPDQRETVRLSAVKAFGTMRDDRGAPRLIEAIDDKSEAVRQAADAALLKCATPQAVKLIQKAAAGPERTAQMRCKLIGMLGEIRSMDSIPALIGILGDEDASVRKAANAALERITLQSFDTVAQWNQWWAQSQLKTRIELLEDHVKRQADRLRAMGQRMEELELGILKDEKTAKDAAALVKFLVESDSRKTKLRTLELIVVGGHKGEPVMAALTGALDDPDAEVRKKCVEAVASQQDPQSAPQLLNTLDDPVPDVQAAAARALGALQAKDAVDPLCRLLASPSEGTATAAAEALGQIGDARAVEPLTNAVARPETPPSVQEAVAKALGKIRDPKAVPALRNLLSSGNQGVRYAAVEALGALQAKEAVGDISEIARKDENSQMREHALATLARIGDPGALDAVIPALSDPVERVATQAFRSLTTLAETNPGLYLNAIDRLIAGGQYALADKVAVQAMDNFATKPNHAKETAEVRARIARGLAGAKEYARARPHLEKLVGANPASEENARDLLRCLEALGDRPARAALLAQSRSRFPKAPFWWEETVRLADEMLAQGEAKEVLALIGALEKENPELGGEKTAAALREIKAKAEDKAKALELPPPAPGNNPPA